MKVYVVVSVMAGCIDEVKVFEDSSAAEGFLAKKQKELDIQPGMESASENDAQLHEVEVEPIPTM